MNYGSINKTDVANGPGVRVSIFVSGCKHACKNCFNEEVWDFNYGQKYTDEVENEILEALDKDYIKGLTLLGGEPMYPTNQERLVSLVKKAKEKYPKKEIWCFTGFEFDTDVLSKMYKFLPYTKEFLKYIDVIVDGKYIDEKRDLNLFFRGSSNQRIIDVQKSIEKNKVVLHADYLFDMKFEEMRINNIDEENLNQNMKSIISRRLEKERIEKEEANKVMVDLTRPIEALI